MRSPRPSLRPRHDPPAPSALHAAGRRRIVFGKNIVISALTAWIAATPGIDVIHIGMNDLLTNLGKPGRFDDPELAEAVERVLAACRANGKHFGCGGNRDPRRQAEIIRKGARFLTTQTDIGLLSAGAAAWTRGIREALEQPA